MLKGFHSDGLLVLCYIPCMHNCIWTDVYIPNSGILADVAELLLTLSKSLQATKVHTSLADGLSKLSSNMT